MLCSRPATAMCSRAAIPGSRSRVRMRLYSSADAPTDLSYTVNELGTVSAKPSPQAARSVARPITGSNGAVSGSMAVCITTGVDSIALQSGGKALINLGQTGPGINVDALAYHPRSYDGSCGFLLQVERVRRCRCGKCGRRFTAGNRMASGTLTCSYGCDQPVHFGQYRHGRRAGCSYRCRF